jgi:hypothetical protein
MTLYGLDPGTTQSALILSGSMVNGQIFDNPDLLSYFRNRPSQHTRPILVIEQIEGMGMAVGREVFETVCWSGRFCEAWEAHGWPVVWLTRRAVKLHLCGTSRAKDTNVRQALLDRYGGKAATKKGGPLYGMKTHLWSALALAITYREQQDNIAALRHWREVVQPIREPQKQEVQP